MCDRPTVLAVAVYVERRSAEADLEAVWRIHRPAAPDQLAAAILEKDADGRLRIDRLDTTATDVAWAGCSSAVRSPSSPRRWRSGPSAGSATQGATWPGIGGVVGYFWDHIPKSQLRRMSDLVETGPSGVGDRGRRSGGNRHRAAAAARNRQDRRSDRHRRRRAGLRPCARLSGVAPWRSVDALLGEQALLVEHVEEREPGDDDDEQEDRGDDRRGERARRVPRRRTPRGSSGGCTATAPRPSR